MDLLLRLVCDQVVKVEGREILAAATFRRWLAEAKPGETLTFEVSREGKPLRVKVRLAPPTKSKLKQP